MLHFDEFMQALFSSVSEGPIAHLRPNSTRAIVGKYSPKIHPNITSVRIASSPFQILAAPPSVDFAAATRELFMVLIVLQF
jgi:hypothetical protein